MNRAIQSSIHPISIAVALASGSFGVAAEESFTLEEVVVTAQKRAQSLQDVPISVAAVDGEKMSEAGIENLQDLSAYVPSLKVVDGGLVPQMYIRGIGSGANQGFEQSVGTYSDGVYAGRSLQSRSSFMDLERVEVLRGPQSILFGQSSIAGAISLVSAKPTDELEGMVSLSHAPETDETEINAVISGPLTDDLGARLAVRDRQEDGFMDNKTRNEDGPALDEQAARLVLAWDITNDLSATFKAEVARVERDGRSLKPIDLGVYPLVVPGLQQTTPEIGHDMWADADNAMSFDSDSYVLNLEYSLGDHTLTSVTAYNEYEYIEDNYDGDTTEVNMVSIDMSEDFEQFSQEIRLASPVGETVDYIVGAFYQTSEQKYQEDASLQVSSLGMSPILDSLVERPFSQESDTWAAFGQVTWNISEELRLSVGLRYTEDEKEGARGQAISSLTVAPGVSQNLVIFPAGPRTGLPVATALAATPVVGGFQLADHNLKADYEEENWTPSVNLQYDLNEDIMLYVNYSEGYKAAGYDARGINGFAAGDTDFLGNTYTQTATGADSFFFDQEEAKTFELGAKMSLLAGTAELNVALFQTDYSDMQVSVFDGAFGFAVDNAGEATVRGLEMDGRWRATESLTLTGSLGYLDFEWTDYEAGACNGSDTLPSSPTVAGNCDYTGMENTNTPEWSASLAANHVYPLSDALELRSTLDANFKDNHYTSGNLDTRLEQAAVTTFNGRVALAATDDTWQVALTGKNLTDKEVVTYGAPIPQAGTGVAAELLRPRTITVEGIYKF